MKTTGRGSRRISAPLVVDLRAAQYASLTRVKSGEKIRAPRKNGRLYQTSRQGATPRPPFRDHAIKYFASSGQRSANKGGMKSFSPRIPSFMRAACKLYTAKLYCEEERWKRDFRLGLFVCQTITPAIKRPWNF